MGYSVRSECKSSETAGFSWRFAGESCTVTVTITDIPLTTGNAYYASVYIERQLSPSLKHLTVYYDTLSLSELRHLMNKLSTFTQPILC
ncbi:hypothetical protein DPMN_102531 [Dreissena polymorpha]|uniref:Uncharacterized protein n=1 Tax=Dreissena polymorpha TaxID=45954 RepID=A0A9D4RAY6_DREPO|nr:hypothetical protein DPMN_102531 [Dreissena polymorpha]